MWCLNITQSCSDMWRASSKSAPHRCQTHVTLRGHMHDTDSRSCCFWLTCAILLTCVLSTYGCDSSATRNSQQDVGSEKPQKNAAAIMSAFSEQILRSQSFAVGVSKEIAQVDADGRRLVVTQD